MIDPDESSDLLRVRVGCDVHYDVEHPAPMLFAVEVQSGAAQHVVQESHAVDPPVSSERVRDSYGNVLWRVVAPAGPFRLRYDAIVAVPDAPDPVLPDLPKTRVEDLPGDAISFLWPSRYCPSDRLIGEAWRLFGDVAGGWAQVQAVCDWMHANIEYGAGSTATTDSIEVYEARRGVCRDFAHLAITFCRALNIPARYVCGYLPDIGVEPLPTPMDFHAWFEVWLDGAWRTFDARHNQPRIGRVVIARGRDAADGAWATVFGAARFVSLRVWADEVDPHVTLGHTPVEPAVKA